MARAPRMEFSGAIYHVMNRGNYRMDIFQTEGAQRAFERTLFEALDRFGWSLRAYVLMTNHFHLCIETPEPNLVVGMQWLESVYANRFNRYRGERGHVFQGRYKALVVEPGGSVLRVVNYIHLNPVKARLVSVERLAEYRFSSFVHLWERGVRVDASEWLKEAGGWTTTKSGLRAYGRYLGRELAKWKSKRLWDELDREFSRGWYIGSSEGRDELISWWSDHGVGSLPCEHGEARAEQLLTEWLKRTNKTLDDTKSSARLADWKIGIASKIRKQTGVTLRWISESLNMGDVSNLSRAIRKCNEQTE